MKYFITGNLGYVGSTLTKYLRSCIPDAKIIGFDNAYFKDNLTIPSEKFKTYVDKQIYGDLRIFPFHLLEKNDIVIQLAAVSNDPMGNKFKSATYDINFNGTKNFAIEAKKRGVRKFIFASSCSIYGQTNSEFKNENSSISPLTEYAKTKVQIETELNHLADKNFQVTCLRFSTACGMSDRLRLDLVLNDFVANAYFTNKIEILSDGKSWRPLIDVQDMCRAIYWATTRNDEIGEENLCINIGKNTNNFMIKELAEIVASELGNTEVIIKNNGEPDKRSYKVDFKLFSDLAPKFVPQISIEESTRNIYEGLKQIRYNDKDFRKSELIRLNKLKKLQEQHKLDELLRWIK